MLGWMDDEALHRTLTTGRCTYWSRSRQEYWVKGDTSGHQQWVKSVALDCDGDALLVKVDQVGAACHTGDRTCFDADVLLQGAVTDEQDPLRREFGLVLLLGAAGAGLVVLAVRQAWAQAIFVPPRPLPAQDIRSPARTGPAGQRPGPGRPGLPGGRDRHQIAGPPGGRDPARPAGRRSRGRRHGRGVSGIGVLAAARASAAADALGRTRATSGAEAGGAVHAIVIAGSGGHVVMSGLTWRVAAWPVPWPSSLRGPGGRVARRRAGRSCRPGSSAPAGDAAKATTARAARRRSPPPIPRRSGRSAQPRPRTPTWMLVDPAPGRGQPSGGRWPRPNPRPCCSPSTSPRWPRCRPATCVARGWGASWSPTPDRPRRADRRLGRVPP